MKSIRLHLSFSGFMAAILSILPLPVKSEGGNLGIWEGEIQCSPQLEAGVGETYYIRSEFFTPSGEGIVGNLEIAQERYGIGNQNLLSTKLRGAITDSEITGSLYQAKPIGYSRSAYRALKNSDGTLSISISGNIIYCTANGLLLSMAEDSGNGSNEDNGSLDPENISKLPGRRDLEESMTNAAAFQLCNPKDPALAAQVYAYNASGIGANRAEGPACVSYLLGYPIGSLRFRYEEGSCEAGNATGVASCIARMSLLCETPTDSSGFSAGFCSSVLITKFVFIGSGDFKYDPKSRRWSSKNIDVMGKER